MWTDRYPWIAIELGDARCVQVAIQNGADVNCVIFNADFEATTPLTTACASGDDPIVRILLDAGADARWYDPDAEMLSSAIVHACSGGHLSTVDLLLHHDKTLLELANDSGWTPLFVAVFRQQTEIVQFLLDRGANVNALGPNGMTTLIVACHEYSLDMVRVLLNAGADVEARTPSQQTALHHAVLCHRVEIVRELILQYNANMFAVDRKGDTPLDWACRTGRTSAVT